MSLAAIGSWALASTTGPPPAGMFELYRPPSLDTGDGFVALQVLLRGRDRGDVGLGPDNGRRWDEVVTRRLLLVDQRVVQPDDGVVGLAVRVLADGCVHVAGLDLVHVFRGEVEA